MSTTLAEAMRALERDAGNDPLLAETIQWLAEDRGGPEDPFADPGRAVTDAARRVNDRRLTERRVSFHSRTLDTTEVIELIDSIHNRKGVDRRRRRGRLLGWRFGRRTLHPEWQFDRDRGDTRPGLVRVLAALRDVATDALAVNALMTTPRADLDGATLAEWFARGEVDTVVRLIQASGDQS